MVLQLDPRVPLVWRSPSSLQFGVDRPRLVLDQLSAIDEQLIAALRRGSRIDRLVRIACSHGGDSGSVSSLLQLLDPLLVVEPRGQRALGRVLIDGAGPTAAALQHAVHDDGLAASVLDTPDFVVLIGNYAIAPRRYGQWLRNDVPLMPIVFGDDGVRVGPLVLPGSGPCLYCLDLARTDTDPAWPAIASQLINVDAPGETARATATVTALVGAVLSEWFAGVANTAQRLDLERWVGNSVRIESSGWISRAQHQPHPACGCQLLADHQLLGHQTPEGQAPPESGTPVEASAAAGL